MNLEILNQPEAIAFSNEVRTFIENNLPEKLRPVVTAERMDVPKELQRQWHRLLQTRGWGCPTWPVEFGGPGWEDWQHYLFEREIALGDAPRSMVYGVGMLAPTLMVYGSEAQKSELLQRIQNADDFWCQGFSEPGAGSDLASLKSRAVREGDEYILNGSKIWTSEAHIADKMFGLFRTDSSGKKQHGITFILLDMNQPGVEVQPIKTYDGAGPEINQVFFQNVRVPVSNRVGEEHQGWGIAKYLLSLERFGTAEVSRSLRTLQKLKAAAVRLNRNDSEFLHRLSQSEIELRAVQLTEYRMLFGDETAGAEASLLKLKGTEVQNDILELFHDLMSVYGRIEGSDSRSISQLPDLMAEAAYVAQAHFNFRKTEIYAGSSEVQKNIIAKAVLGI
ncbi:MAG: alkylation response protein AidB-like acyl-CoA dehydrogenase [Gammaproteobacteria bacterium]|jgi:alkylation response protein AidB-like acyl-CoA dehydrogenase